MAIFANMEEVRQILPDIHKNYNWNSLVTKLDLCTRMYIIPYIGKEQYDLIETAALGGSPDGPIEKILPYIKTAIAYYTYCHLLAANRVALAEIGVLEITTDNSNPASFYAILDARNEASIIADDALDKLLEMMEADKTNFNTWTDSDSYTEIKSCFVWNSRIWSRHTKAGTSRRVYISVRSQLKDVQEYKVLPMLGEALYNELLEQLKLGNLTTLNKTLISKVQAFQAKKALLDAIPTHRIQIIGSGIHFRSFYGGNTKSETANDEAIRALSSRLREQVEMLQTSLQKHLEDNASDYPLYVSTSYNDSTGEMRYKRKNNRNKKSFRF